jgi:hypothetical protein
MPRNFYMRTLLEISFISFELYVALPMGIAIYPQRGRVNANNLEEEFRNLVNENGQAVREFVFNKGL